MSDISADHKNAIGASQVHRIMTYLQNDTLSSGAMSFIQDMCRIPVDEFKTRYESPAMAWGIEQEQHAIAAIAAELGCEIQFSGDEQKRLSAGSEYSDFITALPDAHGFFEDGSIVIIEVKCLKTENHDYMISAVGDDASLLEYEDYPKYAQVQSQNICAEAHYGKPVSSIIVFYDPRSVVKQLHYIIVIDADDKSTIDHEFRANLKKRAMLAKQLYDSIKAEPERAPVVYDGVLPETKLIKSSNDFALTPEILEMGCEEIARKVAKSVGVEIVSLVITNDKDVDIHLKGGEVFNCEVKEGRELSEQIENRIKKIIPAVKKANAPLREAALAEHRKFTKTDRLIEALIMPIVNHVGSKRAEWLAEQKRMQDEILAAEAEKKRLADEQAELVKQAILAKIATFNLSPQDLSSLDLIAEKRVQVESVIVDVMFGSYMEEANTIKIGAIIGLQNAEIRLKQAIEDAEKQARLDAFNVFKDKCEALSDPMHSVEYLESQRFQLFNIVHQALVFGEHYADVLVLKSETLDALNGVLIPAAKQRAIDFAEKVKAEEAAEADKKRLAYEQDNIVEVAATYEVKPLVIAPATVISTETTPEIIEQAVIENTLEHNIIAMYAALNPVLHAKVIEAAGKVIEYQVSEQKASFLHNLFDTDKQGKVLRAAFCLITK